MVCAQEGINTPVDSLENDLPDTLIVAKPEQVQTVKRQPIARDFPLSVFLELSSALVPDPDKHSLIYEYSGVIAFKKIDFGLYFMRYEGSYTQQVIFPNQFAALYTIFGPFIGYKVHDQNNLMVNTRIKFGVGDVLWENAENFEDIFRDKIRFYQPELLFQYKVLPFLVLQCAVGYRRITNLQLPQLNSKDYSGLLGSVGVRIGYFSDK